MCQERTKEHNGLPVDDAIAKMPEFKRAYARAWISFLRNETNVFPICFDFDISDVSAIDVRYEISSYDLKTGELI